MKKAEGPGTKLRLNYAAMRLRDLGRRLFPGSLDPLRIRAVALETLTACTRNCPYCPPHSVMKVPALRMERALFSRVAASLGRRGYSGDIFFSLYGEPLLDDRLESLVAEARRAAPAARLVVFTNGDLLTAERFGELRRAGMDHMPLSLHDPEPSPRLAETLARIAADFPGEGRPEVVDYHSQALPGNDVGLLNNKGGLADVSRRPFFSCCDVESACVDCEGNVPLCNNDCTSSYVFGNAGERDFFDIWEDPLFAGARRRILRGDWAFEICRRCMSRAGRCTAVPAGAARRLPPAFPGAAREIAALRREGGA